MKEIVNIEFLDSMPKKAIIMLMMTIGFVFNSFANTNIEAKEALSKMLEHYSQVHQMAIKYELSIYESEEDNNPIIMDDLVVWIDGKEMYYKNTDFEYYQNNKGSVWLSLQDHVARYTPSTSTSTDTDVSTAEIVTQQMQMLLMVSDSITFSGTSKEGKNIYSLKMLHGTYSKIDLHLNDDYTLDKMVYYYKESYNGYKTEMKLVDLHESAIQRIKETIKPISNAINSNTVEAYYKNYQFLEIE